MGLAYFPDDGKEMEGKEDGDCHCHVTSTSQVMWNFNSPGENTIRNRVRRDEHVATSSSVVGHSANFSNGDTDPTDASALRALYTSLNSTRQLAKWSANGGDPCGESWTGITCSGNKVTEIKISGLGLSGSMGYQLDSLKSVIDFDISNNNIGGIQLPYQLPPHVQRLNIADSSFSGGLPRSISQLTSLQYLNVSHNKIQGSVTVSFDSISALNTLDFSFNSMMGNLPQSFRSLKSMNKMYLQNNEFIGTIDVLANLPLDDLNVENNRFTGWIPGQLKEIVHKVSQSNGNQWSSGPVPPPPGTHPANDPNENEKSRWNSSNLDSNGSEKSGIGGGGIAGIVIFILIVGAIVA